MQTNTYAVGQVWSYQSRDHELDSKLYISQVDEEMPIGPVYHIYLDGLSIQNPHTADGVQTTFPHAPVSAETLDASVTELLQTRETDLPDVSEGYQMWRDAFDKGEAGVFTISVREIVQFIEDAVNGKLDGQ